MISEGRDAVIPAFRRNTLFYLSSYFVSMGKARCITQRAFSI